MVSRLGGPNQRVVRRVSAAERQRHASTIACAPAFLPPGWAHRGNRRHVGAIALLTVR